MRKILERADPLRDAVKVIPITADADLLKMEEAWDGLLQQSHADTIFLTWEWLMTWWEAYGTGKELYILRVEKKGQMIGLAPFYRKTISGVGFLSFRVLAFLGDGSGDSDYLDCISRDGEEDTVTQAIVNFLSQNCGMWDLILLNEVPETSLSLPLLRQLSYQRGWYWEETEVPCAHMDLPSDWGTYLQSLKPRMRTKIRSLMKRLEQDLEVYFDYCQRTDDLAPRLESLFNLHNQRWRHEGKEGVFVSSSKRRFYQEMSSLFLSRGWLRLYSLTVNNRYVAHQFCFEYRDRMFLLQEGFDPGWAEHGVGNVLRAYVCRDCIEHGVAIYDFLGGITPHKESWGAVIKKSLRVVVGSPTLKNRLLFTSSKGAILAKEGLKAILPKTLLEWGKALQGTMSQ